MSDYQGRRDPRGYVSNLARLVRHSVGNIYRTYQTPLKVDTDPNEGGSFELNGAADIMPICTAIRRGAEHIFSIVMVSDVFDAVGLAAEYIALFK